MKRIIVISIFVSLFLFTLELCTFPQWTDGKRRFYQERANPFYTSSQLYHAPDGRRGRFSRSNYEGHGVSQSEIEDNVLKKNNASSTS